MLTTCALLILIKDIISQSDEMSCDKVFCVFVKGQNPQKQNLPANHNDVRVNSQYI